ncbi:hypothetical protein [Aminipila sp.]|uniref:hypothetical protein n=1 Tax=Aminipila sp. TaxID=2060095 RepID=UPI0028997A7C|nr:hypothetical protein [Aminipila sp.]
MEEKQIYDLKSLKKMILGLIFVLNLRNVLDVLDVDFSSMKVICGVLEILGWIFIDFGLRDIRKYSKFNKCYMSAMWMFGIYVGSIIIVFISSVISYEFLNKAVIMVYILIFSVAEVIFFYYLLKSIEEIALQLEEKNFAKMPYMIFIVFSCTVFVNICITISLTTIFSVEENVINMTKIATVIICAIVYAFIYLAYKKLDGREIPNLAMRENN